MKDTHMYDDHLLDHYRSPRYKGLMVDAQLSHERVNALCGDRVAMQCRLIEGRMQLMFDGAGCIISQVAASMLVERVQDMPVEAVAGLGAADMLSMLQLSLGPNRSHCATLALEVLQAAVQQTQE